MQHLFISYSHRDDELVYRFSESLLERGYDLWIDKHSIRVGEQWIEEIKNGIKEAAYMLLVVTENSGQSDYVKKEIAHAKSCGTTIIPIIVDEKGMKSLDVESTQGVSFPSSMDIIHPEYVAALDKLVAHLSKLNPDPNKLWDIEKVLENPPQGKTIGDLKAQWRYVESFPGDLIALRVGYTLYGMEAFLVAPSSAWLRVPKLAQTFIYCSGPKDMYRSQFMNFSTYLAKNNKDQWTLLIRGPVTDDEYRLPNDSDAWKHIVRFTYQMLAQAARGAETHELFLNMPVALGVMLGIEAQRRKGFKCHIYHLDDRQTKAAEYYFKVWS